MTFFVRSAQLIRCLVFISLVISVCATTKVSSALFYHDDLSARPQSLNTILIDSRSLDTCRSKTLTGAFCLSPAQLTHPDGELASMRDINWLFGSLGIDESSTAFVFGDSDADVHFVASLVYILGQAQVGIWTTDTTRLLEQNPTGAGVVSGLLRRSFYEATLRDRHLLLNSDVRQFFEKTTAESVTMSESQSAKVFRRTDGAEVVLAETTREALIAFAKRLATTVDNDSRTDDLLTIKVHVDGLNGRKPSELGVPNTSEASMIRTTMIACAIVLLTFYIMRRRIGWVISRHS